MTKFARHAPMDEPDLYTLVSTTAVSGNNCVGFSYVMSCTLLRSLGVNVLHLHKQT